MKNVSFRKIPDQDPRINKSMTCHGLPCKFNKPLKRSYSLHKACKEKKHKKPTLPKQQRLYFLPPKQARSTFPTPSGDIRLIMTALGFNDLIMTVLAFHKRCIMYVFVNKLTQHLKLSTR